MVNLKSVTLMDDKLVDFETVGLSPNVPFTKEDVSFLDAMFWAYNLENEWLVSEARASILNPPKVKTRSGDRTRSPRWRAGCKSSKRKHFWSNRTWRGPRYEPK